jgi:serine/threonine-protein kinase RIO1
MTEETALENTTSQPLEGMAGLHATLKQVVKKIMDSITLDHIAANLRGGGITKYVITISPAKSGDVWISMDCEVTPIKRFILAVKGLENGRTPKLRQDKDSEG